MKENPFLRTPVSRRETLRLMGAAGVAGFLGLDRHLLFAPKAAPVVLAYENLLGNIVRPSLYSTAPVRFAKQVSEMTCVARPALTEGPFFVDEKLNRSDIRSDPSNNTIKPGVPLKIKINVNRSSNGNCTPLVGAYVDIWHCDALGGYSDVSGQGNPNNIGQKFLRGYQVTDGNGAVEFTTIYPGYYTGRTTHIHYKVRLYNGSTTTYEFTSQFGFEDTLTDQVYLSSPYNTKSARGTRNTNDNIFQSAGSAVVLSASSDGQGGYTTTMDIGLTGVPATTSTVTAVSGASFAQGGAVTADGVASLFGTGLASTSAAASTIPLPTTLGGTSVTVRDANGTTRNAPLFYVAPEQVNFQIPNGTSNGTATLSVLLGTTTVGQGTVTVEAVAPGLFTFNQNGSGLVAAVAQRVKSNGASTYEPIAQYNATTKLYEPVPIDLGEATEQVYLDVFGTGFRSRTSLSSVVCSIGGAAADVVYAGPQNEFVGVDQANLLIPRTLIGRGAVDVVFRADAQLANIVTVNIK